jgi:hypothetical protein
MKFLKSLGETLFLTAYVLVTIAAMVIAYLKLDGAGFGTAVSWGGALAVFVTFGALYVFFPRR